MNSKKIKISRVGNKFLSCYITMLLLLSSLIVIMPITTAEEPDLVTTYYEDSGMLTESSNFYDDCTVFVKVTMDNITGDPPGEYYKMYAKNNDTNDFVYFYVSDNNDEGPWDNTADDGIYWGCFNLSSSEDSQNTSDQPFQDAILKVADSDLVYIYEDPSGLWDNDTFIASKEINIISGGGGPNHPPNKPSNPTPSNNSVDRHVDVSLSWQCSDPDGDPVTYDVYFGTSMTPQKVTANQSGTIYDPGTLAFITTYYWYIVAWDDEGACNNSDFWTFTTEDPGPGGGGSETGISNISGYVLNESDIPIVAATVDITDNESFNNNTITDGSGYYIFRNLDDRTYNISAEKSGEKDWRNNIYVGEGETLYNQNLTLPIEGGSGSEDYRNSNITGYVLNETEAPVQGANVEIMDNESYNALVETDSEGYYNFTDLWEGTYNISADKNGETDWRTNIYVGENETLYNQNLTISTEGVGPGPGGTGTVNGYVNKTEGGGIEYATVILDGDGYYSIKTDSSGFFIFDNNVTEGSYSSKVYKDTEPDSFPQESGDSFGLSDGEEYFLEFLIDIEGPSDLINITVEGYVFQEYTDHLPVSNVNVTVITDGDQNDVLNSTQTDFQGYYQFTFYPNETAFNQGNHDVRFIYSAEGYITDDREQMGLQYLINEMENNGIVEMWEMYLERSWNIQTYINGTIYDLATSQPIENAELMIEGPDYFENFSFTNEDGNFTIGSITGDAEDFELFYGKQGYFYNFSEFEDDLIEGFMQLDPIFLEAKPEANCYIEGYIKDYDSNEPIKDVNLMLYDPAHPFESQKGFFDMPTTDETGYYNMSTYEGQFYLLTLAKIIGETREGPPIGIGGYINDVKGVTISAHETKEVNIFLNSSDSDDVTIDLNFINWNLSYAELTRNISCNPKIVRMMIDSDLDGTITSDEAGALEDAVNSSLTQSGFFDEEILFTTIPFYYFTVDEIYYQVDSAIVGITGLEGSTFSEDPILIEINATFVPTDEINDATLHSLKFLGYLGNPALNMDFTVTIPQGYSFKNYRQWMLDITQISNTQINIVPNQDPDWNDTTFYEPIILSVGSTDPFASFNDEYFNENPYNSDGDEDYDYYICKVKFDTNESGYYNIAAKLYSLDGIKITDASIETYYSSGTKTVELSFSAEDIYMKKIDGPYKIIFDLYYNRNNSYVWFDSKNVTTDPYSYTEFTKPAIYFTDTIIDYGLDEDEDGLYDYLVIGLEVDVGTLGYYEFEGDIGTCDFNYQGDPRIAGLQKGVTFIEEGEQYVNLSFNGGAIYDKGCNASIWVGIWVRDETFNQLDQIDTMTDKYYYTEFSLPPPESCTIQGRITDPFGDSMNAQIWLWDEITRSENTTFVNMSTGEYSINARPGIYSLEINPDDYDYEWHDELVILSENETFHRNITILPQWHQCAMLDRYLDSQQYASGDNIFLNISADILPFSNCTLEIFKEYSEDGENYGEEFISTVKNQTDEIGRHMFVIDTTGFETGEYMFRMWVENGSYWPPVAKDDIWDLQISSLQLDFNINKDNYRPGDTGTGTYNLTYISTGLEVPNANYTWKILTWDWMGEHTLSSGTFTNSGSGSGTFTFSIPSNAEDNDWYDIKLSAVDSEDSEVHSSQGFGITEGSVIESVEDYPVGQVGDYDFLVYNVTVNVTTAGNYRVDAGLEDPYYNWIDHNDTEQYCTAGPNIIKIYFEGEEIQSSNAQSGHWKSWIGLYNAGSWYTLDSLDYTTDNIYNKIDFAAPEVRFEEGISYHTIDGSNGYSAFIVNATINSSIEGDFNVNGNLYKEVLQPGGWYDWYGVSWNRSETITVEEGGTYQPNTSIVMSIRFEGSDIYGSGYNGPYKINFNLHKEIGGGDEWITFYDPDTSFNYDYDDFEKPGALIEGINDYGEVDGDLVIGVLINVSSGNDGDYEINGDLHSSDWYWISNTWSEETLSEGTTELNLTFSGECIYSAGFNGPYQLHVGLQKTDPWQWLGGNEYETNYHNYSDFSLPSAIFEGTYYDSGFDEDDNGLYDSIEVTVVVNISSVGSYEVSGELYKEINDNWYWITWSDSQYTASSTGMHNITLYFNGNQISNSEQEGYYGVDLWLRQQGGYSDLDYINFETNNYYYLNDFDQPSVRFIENSSLPSDSNDSQYLNIDLKVNSSETGTFYINGNLHKVINQGGWNNWIWITDTEEPITFYTEGEQEVTLSYDLSVIQSSGYNGVFTINFEIFDSDWNMLDSIDDYETQSYNFAGLGDLRDIYFTGSLEDNLMQNGEYLLVNVSLQVNETGNYEIGGDLHKESGYNWNYIAGSWYNNEYLTAGHSPQTFQLAFDTIEILDGVQCLNQDIQDLFSSGDGTEFDIDIWVRRSNEWTDLDHLSTQSNNKYKTSDFSNSGVTIESVSDEGFNNSGDEKYEFLNITADVNFSSAGNYEIWCDLSKELSNNWFWLGWKNYYITISSDDVSDGYIVEPITLQFNGERISSEGYDGPYNLYMEVENLDNNKRVARYYGNTDSSYESTDFIGSSIEINESSISDTGVDTDGDGDYNYLSIDIPVISQEDTDIELSADLRKETGYHHEWISWTNNWTSINTGESTVNVQFSSEVIRNSELDGPYSVRIELWDTSNWNLLDCIDNFETTAYTYDNFDAPSASINTSENGITDWGYDSDDSDILYDYLDVNVSINLDTDTEGYFRVEGELFSDKTGWQWIDNTEFYDYLDSDDNVAVLHFDGMKIRNKGINGPYKVRIELRTDDGRQIDSYEPYVTSSYSYQSFQTSGAEIVNVYDRKTNDGDLEVNVTVNCTSSGYYWVGADLHKESGWNWEFIAWESNEGNDNLTEGQEQNVSIIFSGQTIRNKEINGPYQIRLELRDQDTWTEQDVMERYVTNSYDYSEFAEPDLTILSVEDWGNDTDDADSYYNYLELNLTINCNEPGTYWIHGDLEKVTGYNWEWITWSGQELEIEETGEQEIKVQFDGERIYDRGINGPYKARVNIHNISSWTMLDSLEDYSTESYNYENFQRSTIFFVENDTYPSDEGVGTTGSYSYLKITVGVNSSTAGEYWLQCDLHKESGWNWQGIAWEGETITHNGSGIQYYDILFDGSQIRNKGIDGPYQVRIELNSNTGEWRQYDVIESYDTNLYNATDFASAGVELSDLIDGSEDSIVNGNLKINVTVNSTTSGKYQINGDLHKESDWNWQWISFNSTNVEVSATGEQEFSLTFEGSEIYEKEINGPYHVRIELRKVGTDTLIDSIDRYTTNTYSFSSFSKPSGSINDTSDTTTAEGNLQVNISTYSASNKNYQYSGWLLSGDYIDIAWDENSTSVSGVDEVVLIFDGSMINASEKDPEKVYIEMRRTSDWTIIDTRLDDLEGTYSYSDFGAGVSFGTVSLGEVEDYDEPGEEGYGYYDVLNITADITFNNQGTYEISAGLVDRNGSFIAGKNIPSTTYNIDTYPITFSFDGLKIYSKKLDGPYTISFISIFEPGVGEIARATNAFTTPPYSYNEFEHYTNVADGFLNTNYSSSVLDSDGDGLYDYLKISVEVNVTSASEDFDLHGDLYSSGGSKWITADSNNSDYSTYWDIGENIINLYFEGSDIYAKEKDGPYVLGHVRLGANISGNWILLDESSNVITTASYNFTDFENESVAPLTDMGVSQITTSNDPFSPNSDGTKDTTLITVTATGSQNLYLNIYNSTNAIKKTGMSLSETSPGSGTYTATWNGKDNNNSVLIDGTYRIKVSDEATGIQANESDTTKTVVVDTTAPTGSSLEIASGDSHTNSTLVSLTTIFATDSSDKKMRFKNAGGNWTDWEDFQSSRDWTLTTTDGSKTVYFQAKDVAGNIASSVSDGITLDRTKPSNVNITITGKGDTPSLYSNDESVSLSISAEDATSEIEYMMISNTIAFTGRVWSEYNTSKEWSISGDGIKTVYIKVKDRAGMVSDVYSDNITLDTTAPTSLDISINSNQPYTNSTTVTLTLSASDSYTMKMRFNNSGGSWSNWESFNQERTDWNLTSTTGTKTVYFQTKDLAGNLATAVSDDISLDTTSPSLDDIQSSGTTSTSATITWSTDESSTSVVEYGPTVEYGSESSNTTKVKSHSRVITGLTSGTTYHYRVKSRDSAGNLATSIDKTFATSSGADTTPPDAIEGLSVTDKANAEKTVTISWNQSNAPDFAGYKVYMKTSTFNNVTASGVQLLTTITSRTDPEYDYEDATDGSTFYYAVTAIDTATPPNENQSVTVASGTSIDDKAPSTTDNIPGGWQTSEVTVTLTATDNGKGVNKTYYTTDGSDPTNSSNNNRTQYTSPFTLGGDNPLGDDIWTIKYYSYDKNTTPNIELPVKQKTLRVDTTAPSTTDDAPSTWQKNTPVTVTLTPTDETSGVSKTYYTKDGSTPTTSSSQYSNPITFTTQGTRTLKYFSKDVAGKSESVKTSYIYIDTTSPTCTIEYNSSSNYFTDGENLKIYANFTEERSGMNESSVKIAIDYSGDNDLSATLMDKTNNTHWYYDLTIPSGSGYTGYFTVSITAKDNASNSLASTTDNSKYIDNTPPTSSVNSLSTYSVSPFDVSWSSSDTGSGIDSVAIEYKEGSGGTWTSWLIGQSSSGSSSFDIGSAGYTYYFRSIATDNKANVETDYDSNGDTYTTINASSPTIQLTSPTSGSWVVGTININGTVNGGGYYDLTKYWINRSTDRISWTEITSSTSEVSNDILGTFDTTSVSDGLHYIQIYAINSNSRQNWLNFTLNIDNTAPTVTIEFNNSETYYMYPDQIKIYANFTESESGIDESSVKIAIDYTEGTDLSIIPMRKTDNTHWYHPLEILNNGTYDGRFTVSVYAIDNATNNLDSYPTTDSSKIIDNTAPISSVTTISPYWHSSSDLLTISGSASDAGGLKNTTLYYYYSNNNYSWVGPYQYAVDSDPWSSVSWNFNFSNTNDSAYYRFYSIAADNSTKTETAPTTNDTECYYSQNNTPPNASIISSPADNSRDKSRTTDIRWTYGGDLDGDDSANATYDVYFGSSTPPPLVSSGQTATSYDTGNMNYNTPYYWMIITYDNNSIGTAGSIWSFTTEADGSGGGGGDTGGGGDGFSASISSSSTEATVGTVIEFTGSASNGKSPYSYSWDFGDGSSGTGETVTHSYSTIGEYTVTLTVTDNSDSTKSRTVKITITADSNEDNYPSITGLKHSPAKPTKTDMVTISATITDDIGISDANLYWNDGSDHTKAITSSSGNIYSATIGPFKTGKTIKYSVSAIDTADQTTQSSCKTFNIAAVKIVENMSEGETEELSSEELEGTDLDGVTFTPACNLSNVKITVEKLPEKPSEIEEEPEEEPKKKKHIYAYLEIDLTSDNETIEEDKVQSIDIRFKINKTWFTENNIEKDEVILMRYHNGTWQELPTNRIYESAEFVYYQAVTIGTSTFAITGNELIETQPENKETKKPVGEVPWIFAVIGVVVATILIFAFLFKTKILYVEEDKSKEIKPDEKDIKEKYENQ